MQQWRIPRGSALEVKRRPCFEQSIMKLTDQLQADLLELSHKAWFMKDVISLAVNVLKKHLGQVLLDLL